MEKNLVDYLREIKELQEEKLTYSKNIESMKIAINKLGKYKNYTKPSCGNSYLDKLGELQKRDDAKGTIANIIMVIIGIAVFIVPIYIIYQVAIKYNKDALKLLVIPTVTIIILVIIGVIDNLIRKNNFKKKLQNYNDLISKDEERVSNEVNSIKPNLVKKLEYNEHLSELIDKKLKEIYSDEVIPPKYQNYQSAVMFYDYVLNLRCETVRECVRAFELDMKAVYIIDKISMLDCRIEELRNTMAEQIDSLRDSIESSLDKHDHYIERALDSTDDRIDAIGRSMLVEQLYINDMYNRS